LSIGIAIYPADGTDASSLIGNADARSTGRKAADAGTIRFFEADMDQRLRERRALVHDLQERGRKPRASWSTISRRPASTARSPASRRWSAGGIRRAA